MAFAFPVKYLSGTTVVPNIGAPQPLVATPGTIYATLIALVPLRTNTGKVYAGFSSASLAQHIIIPWTIATGDGSKIDLSTIYIDVQNSGEGAAWEIIN